MTKQILAAALAAFALLPVAQAATASYHVTTVWHEPDTQPNDSIFVGTFDYDAATHTITNLVGQLSESMTGGSTGYPQDTMTWLALNNQLVSWYDAALGGTFAATFKNTNTLTFANTTPGATDFWSPQVGADEGGVYHGYPSKKTGIANPGNAYALIFVPENPLQALTQAQLDKVAYADCAPGGMMGAVCMTGTSLAGYGAVGTMSGVPMSQTITAAVPEASALHMALLGAGTVGWLARRRRPHA